MSELELPGSRRASTPGGVGDRHRLRGGSGRSNVLGLINGALLRGLRVSDTRCTSALDPYHHPAACISSPAAAHLQCSDRAADSDLTFRSHPEYRGPSRRLQKRCARSCTAGSPGTSPRSGTRSCAWSAPAALAAQPPYTVHASSRGSSDARAVRNWPLFVPYTFPPYLKEARQATETM